MCPNGDLEESFLHHAASCPFSWMPELKTNFNVSPFWWMLSTLGSICLVANAMGSRRNFGKSWKIIIKKLSSGNHLLSNDLLKTWEKQCPILAKMQAGLSWWARLYSFWILAAPLGCCGPQCTCKALWMCFSLSCLPRRCTEFLSAQQPSPLPQGSNGLSVLPERKKKNRKTLNFCHCSSATSLI